jgi:hypothetical protein
VQEKVNKKINLLKILFMIDKSCVASTFFAAHAGLGTVLYFEKELQICFDKCSLSEL